MEDKYEGFVAPKDGELTFSNHIEERMFRTFLRNFDGESLWLEIKSKSPTRTQRQNRFYWTYLNVISEETGYTPEELHTEFKHEFLKPRQSQGINGTYEETPTTTDLSTKEFNDYIRNIELLTGIAAPSKSRYNL